LDSTTTKLSELWANTLTKYLPDDVLQWIDKKVELAYQNRAYAVTFHKSQFEGEPLNKIIDSKPPEAIVLFHDSMFNQPYEMQEFVVLHEIAHLWLKHHSICGKNQEEKENEADELAKKWIENCKIKFPTERFNKHNYVIK
jgi:hypothetical protein